MTPAIPTAKLGRTGLEVTRLGFGTALRSGLDDDRWDVLLNSVLDSGINFVDTANDYGLHLARPAEERIGRHLSGRRSEFYLATKCGCPPGGGDHVWTRENAFRGLHESLGRLRTDYVDLMQYHNPSVEECEAGDLVRVLEDMREQGKVRWIGVSTTLPHLPTFLEWGVFDVFQIPYSALERRHEEWITRAAQAGTGIVIRVSRLLPRATSEPTSGRCSRRPVSTSWSRRRAALRSCCATPSPTLTPTPTSWERPASITSKRTSKASRRDLSLPGRMPRPSAASTPPDRSRSLRGDFCLDWWES